MLPTASAAVSGGSTAGSSAPGPGATAGTTAGVMARTAGAAGMMSPAATTGAAAGTPAAAPKPAALGDPCLAESDCGPNHCVDGVCCGTAVCARCQRCNSSGSCELQPAGASDDTCTEPGSVCSAEGYCALQTGAKCEKDTGLICLSGHCETVDLAGTQAVCAERPCGVCQFAAKTGDACMPFMNGSDPETCSRGKSCSAGQCVPALTDHTSPIGAYRIENMSRVAQLFTPKTTGDIFELRFRTSCRGPVTFHRTDEADYPISSTELGRTSSGIALELAQPGVEHQVLTAFSLPTPLHVVAGQPLSFILNHGDCYSAAINPGVSGEAMCWNKTGSRWELTLVTLNYTLLIR